MVFFFFLLKYIGVHMLLFALLCSLELGDYHKKNKRINSVWYSSDKMP